MAESKTLAPSFPSAERTIRLDFVDNIRWVMIVLVVSMHAAVTYSHLGSWYFMEDPKPGLAMTALFATYQTFLQAFFMGLLFLIAGYFLPPAFDRKGFWKCLRDRGVRLGIPTLIYMLFIHPFTVYWLLREFEDHTRPSISRAWWPYIVSGRFLSGSGPMWFTLALLIFSIAYAMVRAFSRKPPKVEPEAALPRSSQIVGLALLMGLCTFLVRIVQPMGTNILNMQLCYFSQYVLLFIVGILAQRRNWLLRIPYEFGMRWFTWTLGLGSLVWLAYVEAILKTRTESQISGGVTWQSAVMCLWESFFCVGICLGVIVLFRERFNRLGRISRWLSDNCFAVYLFHTPMLIAVTRVLRPWEAPKPAKFVVATLLGALVTWLASAFVFRRIPILKRVL
jgi:hypothetical protein